jgi:hypothetical protein
MLGLLGREEAGEVEESAILSLLSPLGNFFYQGIKNEERVKKEFYGLAEQTIKDIVEEAQNRANKDKPDASQEEKDKYAQEWAIMQAKFYKVMIALGAAGAIMLFMKSYNWYQAVENIPNVNILGSGGGQ